MIIIITMVFILIYEIIDKCKLLEAMIISHGFMQTKMI